MDLFSAGNESQLDVIKRWIDDSDIYLLILGGRYGSIEPESQISYTQLEYEYALSKSIPLFALVISDECLDRKVKEIDKSVLELNNTQEYARFKEIVTSNLVEFFNDTKDIQLGIHKTLRDFERRYEFDGWVSGKTIQDNTELIKQNSILIQENQLLKEKIEYLSSLEQEDLKGLNKEKITQVLKSSIIDIPDDLKEEFSSKNKDSIYNIIVSKSDEVLQGLTTARDANALELFLFYKVAPKLLLLGITKEKNVYGKSFLRYVLTEFGIEYIREQIMR